MTDKIVVLSACGSQAEGELIAESLVHLRLAACVNILPGVESVYRWQGEVERSSEVLLLIKSRHSLLSQLREEIVRLHSYEVPELAVLALIDGAPAYLNWLERELKNDD